MDLDHRAERLHGAGQLTTSDAHHAPIDHRSTTTGQGNQMINDTIHRWHQHLRGTLAGGLDELLADDVTLYSPIMSTPQHGRQITKMYVDAAAATLAGAHPNPGEPASESGFRYTKELLDGDTAILEFETTIEGTHINGVDIIRIDPNGKIIEIRVMIRPARALQVVQEHMSAAIAAHQQRRG